MRGTRSSESLLLSALVLAACGSSSKSSGRRHDDREHGAEGAPAGDDRRQRTTAFTLPAHDPVRLGRRHAPRTHGKEGHQIAFVKLGDDDVRHVQERGRRDRREDVARTRRSSAARTTPIPAESVTATVHLEPGTYGVACFIPAQRRQVARRARHDRPGHGGADGRLGRDARRPPTPARSTLERVHVRARRTFTGKGTVEITNPGTQVHELIIVKLNPGKTLDDAKKFFLTPPGTPPPPVRRRSQRRAASSGSARSRPMYQTMALTPGKYVLICFFPDRRASGDLPARARRAWSRRSRSASTDASLV